MAKGLAKQLSCGEFRHTEGAFSADPASIAAEGRLGAAGGLRVVEYALR